MGQRDKAIDISEHLTERREMNWAGSVAGLGAQEVDQGAILVGVRE
jgi:hypothetical protein